MPCGCSQKAKVEPQAEQPKLDPRSRTLGVQVKSAVEVKPPEQPKPVEEPKPPVKRVPIKSAVTIVPSTRVPAPPLRLQRLAELRRAQRGSN